MQWCQDVHNRQIRLTDERRKHLENDHPEMSGQIEKVEQKVIGYGRRILQSLKGAKKKLGKTQRTID